MNPESKYIIGKIPGYNKGILPVIDTTSATGANKQDLYNNRLLNNLNTIEFTPTSYQLQFTGDIAAIITAMVTDATNGNTDASQAAVGATWEGIKKIAEGTFDAASEAKGIIAGASAVVDGIAAVSKELTGETIKVSRRSNSQQWQEVLYLGILNKNKANQAALTKTLRSGFVVLGTNDSSFNETLSNTFGMNKFQEAAGEIGNKIRESAIGVVGTAMAYWKSMDSNAGLAGLQVQGKFGLLGALSGLVQGVKIELPQVWQNADYNSSLNIILKLISPSGDSASIQRYIKDPLEILLRATSPITIDGITFGYPMIWDVRAHGIMHMKLAAITALSITRGGNDTVFNRFEEPLNIDVRLMITPINPGFAQGPMADYSMTDPTDVIYSISSSYKQRSHEILNEHLLLNEQKLNIKKIMI